MQKIHSLPPGLSVGGSVSRVDMTGIKIISVVSWKMGCRIV